MEPVCTSPEVSQKCRSSILQAGISCIQALQHLFDVSTPYCYAQPTFLSPHLDIEHMLVVCSLGSRISSL